MGFIVPPIHIKDNLELPPGGYSLIIKGVEGAIAAKTVTYDLERLMEGASKVSCSGFGEAVVGKM